MKKQEEFAKKGKVSKREEPPKKAPVAEAKKETPPESPSESEESEEEPAKQFQQISKKKQAPAPLVGQGKKTKTQLQKEALNTVQSSPLPE